MNSEHLKKPGLDLKNMIRYILANYLTIEGN